MDYLNVMIDNGHIMPSDREMLFPHDEEVARLHGVDMFDLLVTMGVFVSRSDAGRNWRGTKDVPMGWSRFVVGKLRKELCIWNPST
jgi:hypothetical protein